MKHLLLLSMQGCDAPFDGMFPQVKHLHDLNDINKDSVLMFEGGTDISTKFYHEPRGAMTDNPDVERDKWEKAAFDKAQEVGACCIGICRGSQLLTALSGGKLVQHISGHGGTHLVETFDGQVFPVTSTHHQMMYPFDLDKDNDYVLLAWADHPRSEEYLNGFDKHFAKNSVPCEPDMVWYPQTRSLCIQSHPEYLRSIKGGMDSPFVQYCRKLVNDFIFNQQ